MKISQAKLKDLLHELGDKVPFIGMDVETEPKVNTNAIIKRCSVRCRAGAHVKEPMGPRKWGERVEGTPLVAHKGQLYLEVEVTSVKDEVFTDKDTGVVITLEEAKERGYRHRPAGLQKMRDYKLSSIKRIRMNKNEYEISPDKSLV